MDVREKLFTLFQDCNNPSWKWFPNNAEMLKLIDYLIANGVTAQECIPVTDVSWLGEDISKLCIRYMTEYADFHGYASQKKVKAHIIRLLQAEADGRIAIMPQPPKGE